MDQTAVDASAKLYLDDLQVGQRLRSGTHALDAGQTLVDIFTYMISDGALSVASTLSVTVFGTNDAPTIGTAIARVSEEGLAGGVPDALHLARSGLGAEPRLGRLVGGAVVGSGVFVALLVLLLRGPVGRAPRHGSNLAGCCGGDRPRHRASRAIPR